MMEVPVKQQNKLVHVAPETEFKAAQAIWSRSMKLNLNGWNGAQYGFHEKQQPNQPP